jgi:hypothetical protein
VPVNENTYLCSVKEDVQGKRSLFITRDRLGLTGFDSG